jgi:hypothetical protein
LSRASGSAPSPLRSPAPPWSPTNKCAKLISVCAEAHAFRGKSRKWLKYVLPLHDYCVSLESAPASNRTFNTLRLMI